MESLLHGDVDGEFPRLTRIEPGASRPDMRQFYGRPSATERMRARLARAPIQVNLTECLLSDIAEPRSPWRGSRRAQST